MRHTLVTSKQSKGSGTGRGPEHLSPTGLSFVIAHWELTFLSHASGSQWPWPYTHHRSRVPWLLRPQQGSFCCWLKQRYWTLELPWEDPYWELERGFAVISKQPFLGNVSSDLPHTKPWIATGNDMQHDLWKWSWLIPCVWWTVT